MTVAIDDILASEMPEPAGPPANAEKVAFGKIIPPQQQILIYSPDEWEGFIHEWVESKKPEYSKVVRLSGATDMGIDVAGLVSAQAFQGVWDNFQCKHYDNPLTPGTAIPEIGKMLWHSFQGQFKAPRSYFFMAPKGCGISLQRLLLDPASLKAKVIEQWDNWCAKAITANATISLDGPFLAYVDAYDYSTFSYKNPLEVAEEHRKTKYFNVRFGGGLAQRPPVNKPPSNPVPEESRYLEQLFEAYSDSKKMVMKTISDLSPWPPLTGHYHRQREHFYHAESLRNFARDTVPHGTFESLQDEVHAGVVDISEAEHPDGLACLNAVTQAAQELQLTENGLISVVKVHDRRGICHQLANVDRLKWKK